MKVITWNCHQAFSNKHQRAMALEPGLLIVQECEHPSKISGLDWNEQFWTDDNQHKGLGVFSFNDMHISKPEGEC